MCVRMICLKQVKCGYVGKLPLKSTSTRLFRVLRIFFQRDEGEGTCTHLKM